MRGEGVSCEVKKGDEKFGEVKVNGYICSELPICVFFIKWKHECPFNYYLIVLTL